MDAEKINIYAACDKAIRALDRLNLEAFGALKMAKFDEINVIQTVLKMYRKSMKQARKRYYEVAYEAYLLALSMVNGIDPKKSSKMVSQSITVEWLDEILGQTDPLTLYRFDTETERKAYRLAEALEGSQDRDYEINKALRFWSQQLAQYAVNFTDYAVVKAFQDAGVKVVEWMSAMDEKVCNECHALDGQRFLIEELPPKPHWGCRCRIIPVK